MYFSDARIRYRKIVAILQILNGLAFTFGFCAVFYDELAGTKDITGLVVSVILALLCAWMAYLGFRGWIWLRKIPVLKTILPSVRDDPRLSVSRLASMAGWKEERTWKALSWMLRKKCLINCHLDLGEEKALVLDGVTVVHRTVNRICPGCGAAVTGRSGSEVRCEYCGLPMTL